MKFLTSILLVLVTVAVADAQYRSFEFDQPAFESFEFAEPSDDDFADVFMGAILTRVQDCPDGNCPEPFRQTTMTTSGETSSAVYGEFVQSTEVCPNCGRMRGGSPMYQNRSRPYFRRGYGLFGRRAFPYNGPIVRWLRGW